MKIFLFMPLFLSSFLYSSNPLTYLFSNPKSETLSADAPAWSLHRAYYQQAPPGGTQPTNNITINVPVQMHMHNNATQQTEQSFQPNNTVHASSESKAITITKHWQQLNAYMAPLNQELGKITSMVQGITRRWYLYASGGTYGGLFFFLVKTNHQMNAPESWSQWKNHMNLSELQLHAQSKLAQDLLHDIQHRYMNKANPTDGITPLARFIIGMEQEKHQIEKYLYVTSWLSTLWLKRLFPFNDKKVDQARIARERLNFVNHIFISWASTQSINNITQ